MELMGHKRPEMTMRYTHLSVGYKRQEVAQLEKLGNGVVTNSPMKEEAQDEPQLQVIEK